MSETESEEEERREREVVVRQGSRPGYRCSLRCCKYGGLEILSTETVQGQRSSQQATVQYARLQTRAGAVKGAYLAMTLAMTNRLLASCRSNVTFHLRS